MEGGRRRMENYMKDCTRKLALWFTRTFKPIMTHEELEPIMATLGFIGLPPSNTGPVSWKEYVYTARCCRSCADAPPPRPRLPFPRVDGLHIYTYRAFLDSVNFYLDLPDISDLFHIRGMPIHPMHDQRRKWRPMEEEDHIFVYREGTLDQATSNLYRFDKNSSNNECRSIVIRDKGMNTPATCIVSLKDLV